MNVKPNPRKPTSLRLTDEQRKLIEDACESTGLSISQILETALAETLDEFERTGAIRVRRIRNKNKNTPSVSLAEGGSLSDKISRGVAAIRQ